MKKILLTLPMLVLATALLGQVAAPDTTRKEHKNVISLNATWLLKQFLSMHDYWYVNDPYIIGYKRMFGKHALRVNLGGYYNRSNGTDRDTINTEDTRYNFNIGLGYEHYTGLSRRWSLYFGADAILFCTLSDAETLYPQSSSLRKSKDMGYGISPLLGVQFRLNKRLSISTETSLDITFVKSSNQTVYFPETQYNRNTKSSGLRTEYHAPISIFFRVKV